MVSLNTYQVPVCILCQFKDTESSRQELLDMDGYLSRQTACVGGLSRRQTIVERQCCCFYKFRSRAMGKGLRDAGNFQGSGVIIFSP